MRRVAVTGMAGVTAFGDNWATIEAHLRSGKNAVRRMHEWDYFDNLNSRSRCAESRRFCNARPLFAQDGSFDGAGVPDGGTCQ